MENEDTANALISSSSPARVGHGTVIEGRF